DRARSAHGLADLARRARVLAAAAARVAEPHRAALAGRRTGLAPGPARHLAGPRRGHGRDRRDRPRRRRASPGRRRGGRVRPGDPGPDGTLVIDLNRTVNLPCAFIAYATCPLPPAGNTLTVPVEAGEKSPLRPDLD